MSLTTNNKLCTCPIKLVPPFRTEAELVHSRIHLEVDVNWSLELGGGDKFALFVTMHGDCQAEVIGGLNVVVREHAFKEQDGLLPPELTNADCFVEVEQCNTIGPFKSRIDAFDSVSISVRLYDGPNARFFRFPLDDLKIVPYSIRMDIRFNRSRHGFSLSKEFQRPGCLQLQLRVKSAGTCGALP